MHLNQIIEVSSSSTSSLRLRRLAGASYENVKASLDQFIIKQKATMIAMIAEAEGSYEASILQIQR